MTTAAAAIAVAVVAAVLFAVFGRSLTDDSPTHGSVRTENDQWLALARSAVKRGQSIAAHLAVESAATMQVDADAIDELDGLTEQMIELSTTAPTAMDAWVSRNLAVRCRVLSDALRSLHDDEDTPVRSHHPPTPPLPDRRAEFEVAIRDLAEHVNLV